MQAVSPAFLTDTVTIEHRTDPVRGKAGGPGMRYGAPVGPLACSVSPATSDTLEAFGAIEMKNGFELYFPADPAVRSDDKITWAGWPNPLVVRDVMAWPGAQTWVVLAQGLGG
jgi:hypothetical protein